MNYLFKRGQIRPHRQQRIPNIRKYQKIIFFLLHANKIVFTLTKVPELGREEKITSCDRAE